MKTMITILFLGVGFSLLGQTTMREKIDVEKQERLVLEIEFADDINVEYWTQKEVLILAEVSINEGKSDSLFSFKISSTEDLISVKMDKDRWDRFFKTSKDNCIRSDVQISIKMPQSLKVEAESISGNFTFPYPDHEIRIKTISGDIDLSIPAKSNLEFHAKTISGEVYSDLDISYPYGKEGLTQIVGMNVKGQINKGGPISKLETISGNIYLRKN